MPSKYREYRNANNKRHRDDGLPAVEWTNGTKEWFVNGVRQRVGGLPAIEMADGSLFWFVNGVKDRVGDLPAVVRANGDKEWWVGGVNITEFRAKYRDAQMCRAQKRIYFWIIQRLYRPGSESAKRLAEASWQATMKEMESEETSFVSTDSFKSFQKSFIQKMRQMRQ